ncbi:hypothetical protein O3M35_012545 [Rhynocoris fuscipes]|uniref:Fatty acyl-CoA reductase n=1 Tax=Rhynocoris fuscipes TaxID=488301 RepID=A0AAW1CWL5_9HEMI
MSESIREWLNGKSILITGGTGFMGKVLLEKLLRSCPGIKKIYVCCRYKKNLSPAVRVAQILKLPLFDRLRKENPSALLKVVSVYCELTRDDLGIKHEDLENIRQNVNVVFNMAASLKLEAPLKSAIIHNTVGTMKILDLAKSIKNLEVFVHISTTFCHPEEKEIKEGLLNTTFDLDYILELVQLMDEDELEKLRPKILGQHPNAYTFSKALTEKLLESYAEDLPISIARPSIVIPTLKEPVPGWVDSLNGPIGVLAAAGKGVLRSMLCDPNAVAQIIPVDIATNAIIIVAWKKATKREKDVIPVYNLSCDEHLPITWGEVLEKGRRHGYEYPVNPGLWYPNGAITTNPIIHTLTIFFLQVIPAYFVDFLFLCFGQKPFMVYVQKRIGLGLKLLQYFTLRSWKVHVEKAAALINELQEDEKQIFYTSNVEYDIDDFMIKAILGAREYCLKEPNSTLPRARFQLKIYYAVDILTKIALSCLIIWCGYKMVLRFH